MNFLNDIKLLGNQILDCRIENRESDPSTNLEGSIYFNTVRKVFRVCKNGEWGDLVSYRDFVDYFLPLTGGTMTGDIVMSDITAIQFGNGSSQSKIKIRNGSSNSTDNILRIQNTNLGDVIVRGIATPDSDNDAVNRGYIDDTDNQLSAGLAIGAYKFVFQGTDKKLYPVQLNTANTYVNPNFGLMATLSSYTKDSNVAKLYDKVTEVSSLFGISTPSSNTTPVHVIGHCDSNGMKIFSTIVGEYTYSSIANTYMYIGDVGTDGYLRINTSNKHFISVDSNYKIIRIDGVEINSQGTTTSSYNNPVAGESVNLNSAEDLSVGDIVVKLKTGFTNGGFLCKFNSSTVEGYDIDFDWGYAMCVKAMTQGTICDKTHLMQQCRIANQVYIDGQAYYIKCKDTVSSGNYLSADSSISASDYAIKITHLAYIGTGISDNALAFDASNHRFLDIIKVNDIDYIAGVDGREIHVDTNYRLNNTSSETHLSSDVTITSTSLTDVLSLSIGAGKWLINVHVTLSAPTTVSVIQRGNVLITKTASRETVVCGTSFSIPYYRSNVTAQNVSLCAVVNTSETITLKIRAQLTETGSVNVCASTPLGTSSGPNATTLIATRIG